MSDEIVRVYPRLNLNAGSNPNSSSRAISNSNATSGNKPHVLDSEAASCSDSEPFALRVLDDSMEPEFRKGCIIVIDPTGHARDGSYVLARHPEQLSDQYPDGVLPESPDEPIMGYIFRQLRKQDEQWMLVPLNNAYQQAPTKQDLGDIEGVIVQRAGVRRNYHKRYD